MKRIVLTGVTRGLGRALARRFAALGHRVVGCGRSLDSLRELALELGPGHFLQSVDVVDRRAVRSWSEDALADGAPDLLINNAGVLNRPAPLWKVPADDFDRVIDVNIKGVANVIRAFVPSMVERRSGVIVNFSSGWGQTTAPDVAPYCASKFAIEGLTKALAQELPTGMAAVPLSPGIIHTDMLDTAFGTEASSHWSPRKWVEQAAPFILDLGPEDNGHSLRIPGS